MRHALTTNIPPFSVSIFLFLRTRMFDKISATCIQHHLQSICGTVCDGLYLIEYLNYGIRSSRYGRRNWEILEMCQLRKCDQLKPLPLTHSYIHSLVHFGMLSLSFNSIMSSFIYLRTQTAIVCNYQIIHVCYLKVTNVWDIIYKYKYNNPLIKLKTFSSGWYT